MTEKKQPTRGVPAFESFNGAVRDQPPMWLEKSFNGAAFLQPAASRPAAQVATTQPKTSAPVDQAQTPTQTLSPAATTK